MELRHLEYFVAVAGELNFSRAAGRIHVAQSALSAAVNKLEKELGVELFDRTKRPIELTKAGGEFLRHARTVLLASQRARASVQPFHGHLTGTVTLGTLMSWGALDLPAALAEYRILHPSVTLLLRQSVDGSAGHLKAIADGELDAALVSVEAPLSPEMRMLELGTEPMVFVCHGSHPLADRSVVEVADLVGLDFVTFPAGWGIREQVDAGFATVGSRPVGAYQVADFAIAADLVRYGLAVTILPTNVAARFPDLRRIAVQPMLTWTLSIVCTPASHADRPTNELMSIIIRQMGHDAEL